MIKVKRWKTQLQEAFARKNVEIAIMKTCKILGKRIGKKIRVSLIPMDVIKSTGQRLSGLIATFDNKQIRFNWKTTDKSSTIISIDYWEKIKKNPDYTLETGDFNIIQLLKALEQFILNPTVGEILTEDVSPGSGGKVSSATAESINAWAKDMGFGEQDLANRRITELYNQYLFWYRESGLAGGYREVPAPTFRLYIIKYLEKYGITNIFMRSVTTKVAGKEKVIISDQTESKDFQDEIYAMTLNDKVDFVKQSVRMVVQGLTNCLIIGGTAGVGKTTLVNEVMQEVKGKKVVHIKGGIKDPEEYYKFLYRNNGSITVIDDTDILLSSKFIDIQKAALDSAPKRIITMFSKDINDDDILSNVKSDAVLDRYYGVNEPKSKKIKYPTSFELTSRFIILTNMPKKKVNSALISRGTYIEMLFTPTEIADSMRVNVSLLFPEFKDVLTDEMKLDVLDFVSQYMKGIKQLDYRIMKTICMFRALQPTDPMWKKKAYAMLKTS